VPRQRHRIYEAYRNEVQISEPPANNLLIVEFLGQRFPPRDDDAMPNTFTSLHYHIIVGTRNREPFLDSPLRERIHAYLGGCVGTLGGVPLEIGGVSDHVHLLVGLKPIHCVADVLRSIKKASSEWAHEMGLTPFRWQDGYSAFTVGTSGVESVRRYIANQAEHHRKKTFEEEYRALLKAHVFYEGCERFLRAPLELDSNCESCRVSGTGSTRGIEMRHKSANRQRQSPDCGIPRPAISAEGR
jgi:REP element-mobilizing transposase RayT